MKRFGELEDYLHFFLTWSLYGRDQASTSPVNQLWNFCRPVRNLDTVMTELPRLKVLKPFVKIS
jgi:hypothetical protein